MFKKILNSTTFLLLLTIFLSHGALKAQVSYSDTIGNTSTTTSTLSVLPGYYGYHFSATLYTAAEINHAAGDISSLSYLVTYGNYPVNSDDKHLKIYLMETTSNSLDLTQTWTALTSAATLVYDSLGYTVEWDEYWKEFLFSQPFAYQGGNLIVLIEGTACDPVPSMGDCETEMYVNNGTTANCWIRVQDSNPISTTSALSSIAAGTHGNNTDRPNVFFTFQPQTEPVCTLTVPYTEDFNSYPGDFTAFPTCWTRINTYQSGLSYECPIVSNGASTGTNNLFFFLMGVASQYAILPQLDSTLSVSDLTMSFTFKSAQQYTTRLEVGVMTDPTDTLTFEPIDTVFRTGATMDWENQEINFAAYTGTGRYLALRLKGVSTGAIHNCFIDDVHVSMSDFCTPPVQITSSEDNGDVTISWFQTSNSNSFMLYYKPSTATVYDSVEVMANSYTFTNLPANTLYEYYLVSICDVGAYSQPSEVNTFSTPCNTINNYPWLEDFENETNCWSFNASAAGQDWQCVSNGTNPTCSPVSGTHMMKMDNFHYTAGSWASMTTPAMSLDSNMILSFKYYRYGPQQAFDMETYDFHDAADSVEVFLSSTPSLDNAQHLTTVFGFSAVEGWDSTSVNISVTDPQVAYVIFKATSDYGYNIYIDDVMMDFATVLEPEDDVLMTIDTSICEDNVLEIYGESYNQAGTYTIILPDQTGGNVDTIITLNLTVNPVYVVNLQETITMGETYTDNGFNESQEGTYYQYLTTQAGCDSTIVLHLTVQVGVRDYNEARLTISPNPVSQTFTVTTDLFSGKATVELYNISGQKVQSAVVEGRTNLMMNRENLPSGVYMLKITNSTQQLTRKVIFL